MRCTKKIYVHDLYVLHRKNAMKCKEKNFGCQNSPFCKLKMVFQLQMLILADFSIMKCCDEPLYIAVGRREHGAELNGTLIYSTSRLHEMLFTSLNASLTVLDATNTVS